ncbi:hypothetical protein RMSM_06126 [Rhodopirellula maiorica SM1]|uniref:Uncharacterized protein n=1 Tax=Rhodopirellula maiorica SM1 TaxID=1265738 RepID=M5RNI9_9BACT|nr:hypothetical protein RMSM_06126 [Rhodopirellula maiorica SM1]
MPRIKPLGVDSSPRVTHAATESLLPPPSRPCDGGLFSIAGVAVVMEGDSDDR